MITLQDVKDDYGIRNVASHCPDSPEFLSLLHTVCRILLRRGDWAGTVVPIYLCVRGGCVVWPRYVKTVRAVSWCNRGIQPKNLWGDFLPRGPRELWKTGLRWYGGRECDSVMVQKGRTSVYQDVQGDGRLIRAYARCNNDYGKKLYIFGEDNNGQELMRVLPDGSYVKGLELILGAPFVSTSVFVRRIDYIIKELTECPVNVYAYWVAEDVQEDIAQYDGSETNPDYAKTRVSMPWAGTGACSAAPTTSTCCDASRGVAALVKLQFIPPRTNTDIVIPDCMEAIKYGIQSVKFGEAGDIENKKAFEADAIAELNRELEDSSPDDQFVADNQIFAGQTFTNRCF